MAQKVISVNIELSTSDGRNFLEIDFPKVTEALSQGYTVKQIIQSVPQTRGNVNLTFMLENEDEQVRKGEG